MAHISVHEIIGVIMLSEFLLRAVKIQNFFAIYYKGLRMDLSHQRIHLHKTECNSIMAHMIYFPIVVHIRDDECVGKAREVNIHLNTNQNIPR